MILNNGAVFVPSPKGEKVQDFPQANSLRSEVKKILPRNPGED